MITIVDLKNERSFLMKIFPKISESEWEIMKLIWKTNPLTSEQIINSLSDKMNWSTQTIKTFITRLIKKVQ